MAKFSIYPIFGLKTDVGEDDPSLFQPFGNGFACHCVDGRNISFNRVRNATSKAEGYSEWSNSATDTAPTACLGLFELYDGSNRKIWIAYNGDVYRYDSSRDPQEVADTAATTWATDVTDYYSFLRYGSFMVFSDNGEHAPYCADHDDTNLIPLISSGTQYKAKYLESFQRRILMAYVTAGITTGGDLSVIWSDANPVAGTSCTFGSGDPPTNHLYVPVDDSITGIKRMGMNACVVYTADSINSLDYYVDYVNPFGFTTVVANQGCSNHFSIVDTGSAHYFFNKNYGFCRFDGSRNFPSGGRPISYPINNWVRDIRSSTFPYIIGVLDAPNNEIGWIVALDGAATPNAMLFYDYFRDAWRRLDIAARFVTPAILASNVTWTTLGTLGYTDWASLGNLTWSSLINESNDVLFSETDGKLYYIGTEGADGGAWDAYRVEPVIDFGDPDRMDLLREINFNLVDTGNYSLYVYHRGGSTVGECTSAPWSELTSISCNDPAKAVTYCSKPYKFHQIKWGTDSADEAFVVNRIDFEYSPQGKY